MKNKIDFQKKKIQILIRLNDKRNTKDYFDKDVHIDLCHNCDY